MTGPLPIVVVFWCPECDARRSALQGDTQECHGPMVEQPPERTLFEGREKMQKMEGGSD